MQELATYHLTTMKNSYLLLLLVSFLILSPGLGIKTGQLAEAACMMSPIHLPNCSHEACVQSCVEKYGECINGGCIDYQTCYCRF
ncbi:hypothetical protein ES332_A07G039900v1 [Gossypium tomentosum]|uniref:Knottin scorpion toxin-like domain-containing protein n=1 Tax=Gossypium tomentosum TaxID=34277 RepID=A0A5D2PN16_GOSTO|nr:hypothetical protein ES332_A07G039900v1 [Gossypium tomentosum]